MKRFGVMVCALALIALMFGAMTSTLAAVPNYETHAYYSVVADVPYAPYTTLKATSLLPYYSVLH